MKTFAAISNVYGVERLDKEIAKDLCCAMCHSAGPLYTNEDTRLPKSAVTPRAYAVACRNRIERIRNTTFCRRCVVRYYGE